MHYWRLKLSLSSAWAFYQGYTILQKENKRPFLRQLHTGCTPTLGTGDPKRHLGPQVQAVVKVKQSMEFWHKSMCGGP